MRVLPGWRAQPHQQIYTWAEETPGGMLRGRLEELLWGVRLLVTWQVWGGGRRILDELEGHSLDKLAQRGLELLAKHSAALRLGWRP